jgi:hypothetical protein
MSLKHAFTSAAGASSDATKVDGTKWNADHVVDSAGIDMASSVAGPAAPVSGLRAFAQEYAGRPMLAGLAALGSPVPMQTSFARCRPAYWLAVGTTTAVSAVGISFNPGSPTARGVGFANFFDSTRRVEYVTAASANANVNARAGAERAFFIGTSPKMGGFFNVWRFGTSAYVSDARCFFGLAANNASFGAMSPSSLVNMMGMGFDPGDTTWSVYSNDGAGLPSKTTLSASFPCNTNSVDVIEFAMYVAPNSQAAYWQVTNVTTGAVATGAFTADIPVTQAMQPHISVSTGASAISAGAAFMSMYIETEN